MSGSQQGRALGETEMFCLDPAPTAVSFCSLPSDLPTPPDHRQHPLSRTHPAEKCPHAAWIDSFAKGKGPHWLVGPSHPAPYYLESHLSEARDSPCQPEQDPNLITQTAESEITSRNKDRHRCLSVDLRQLGSFRHLPQAPACQRITPRLLSMTPGILSDESLL